MSGWALLLTHLLCFGAGAFVSAHPDKIKGWLSQAIDKISRKPRAP